MAYPTIANVSAAVLVLENALAENKTIPGAQVAWQSLHEATSFIGRLPGTDYDTIVVQSDADFGGVL